MRKIPNKLIKCRRADNNGKIRQADNNKTYVGKLTLSNNLNTPNGINIGKTCPNNVLVLSNNFIKQNTPTNLDYQPGITTVGELKNKLGAIRYQKSIETALQI